MAQRHGAAWHSARTHGGCRPTGEPTGSAGQGRLRQREGTSPAATLSMATVEASRVDGSGQLQAAAATQPLWTPAIRREDTAQRLGGELDGDGDGLQLPTGRRLGVTWRVLGGGVPASGATPLQRNDNDDGKVKGGGDRGPEERRCSNLVGDKLYRPRQWWLVSDHVGSQKAVFIGSKTATRWALHRSTN
jgi:hypothetical protein